MKLYHTTSPDRVNKILKEGLKINSPINKTYAAAEYIKKAYRGIIPIFLSIEPGKYKNGIILEVDVTGFDLVADIPSLLDHDGYMIDNYSGIWWEEMVNDPKADLIYKLGDKNGEIKFSSLNKPNSTKVNLAIQITETCAVKQDIPPDRIKVVGNIDENIDVDIDVGDTVLGGRFKNKQITVKKIGKDELNQPTINDKPLLKYRIKKDMPEKKKNLKEIYEEELLLLAEETNKEKAINFLRKVKNKNPELYAKLVDKAEWWLKKQKNEYTPKDLKTAFRTELNHDPEMDPIKNLDSVGIKLAIDAVSDDKDDASASKRLFANTFDQVLK